MQFPDPTVDIGEIRRKYHEIVEEEGKQGQVGGKQSKKGKKGK